MKQWSIITALALGSLSTSLGATPQIHMAPSEWSATGDFNGDGLTDWALVDRSSGNYRVAYQLSPEQLTWTEPRSGGVQDVTGVTVGDVVHTGLDSLLLTSPLINRVQIMDLSKPDVAALPLSLHVPSVGPLHVASLDIGGGGNTAHDDIWVYSSGNGPASPYRQTNVRAMGGGGFSTLSDSVLGNRVVMANRFEFKLGGTWGLSALVDMGGMLDYQLYETSSGVPVLVDESIGLPGDVKYFYESYQVGSPSQTLFYLPGDTRLFVLPLREPVPGTYKFDSMLEFDLGVALEEIVPIADLSPKFLALFKGRKQAGIYDFDGVNPPKLIQDFEAEPGQEFTSVGGLGLGQMSLLSGQEGTGISSQFVHWVKQGEGYVEKDKGFLSPLNQYAASANVFLFQSEPFVNANPVLMQSFSSGQWTSGLLLSGAPPQVKVVTEQFINAEKGLGQPSAVSLGQADSTVHFGMVNQFDDTMSLFSFRPAVGNEVVEIQASPSPGQYAKAIHVTLTPSPAGAQLFYRLGNSSPWVLYSSPVTLFKNTELSVYGQVPPGTEKSPIQTLEYTFETSPSEMDSDSDGVPDFVELGLDQDLDGNPDFLDAGKGLDPVTVSDDSDGDGFSDLNELIEGTNPYDAAETPAGEQRLEANAGFNLFVEPLPWDGSTQAQTSIASDELVQVFGLDGGGLGEALTADVGGGEVKAVVDSIVANSDQRLIVAATSANYDIDTGGTDKTLGREMVTLVPAPILTTALDVAYSIGNADAATEASNWVAAAQTAQSNRAVVELEADMTVEDVLIALLVEKKIETLLVDRGVFEAEDALTLFPHRPLDADRRALSETDWLALESDLDESNSGYRVDAIHSNLEDAVVNPASDEVTQLVALVRDIYQISSALSNANEGVYVSPISVLRDFLETSILNEAYSAQTTLEPLEVLAAGVGCDLLLDQAIPRPRDTFTLVLAAGQVSHECTVLEDAGQLKALVYPDGSAYLLPEAFLLPAGSAFQVEAYTDQPQGPCLIDTLEVISIDLISVPAGSISDHDGDLMPDDFECLFLGGVEALYDADADGDGVSNGQEYADGTDPSDPDSFDPDSINISELPPPPVYLVTYLGGNDVALDFIYPESDIAHLTVAVSQSGHLDGTFIELPVTPVLTGPDQWRVLLPDPGAPQQFYRVEMMVTP